MTSDLCHDIINDSAYNVRILSIRQTKNLNQPKLRSALQYACRSSRPDGSPRLKGIYIFTSKDNFVTSSRPAGDNTSISADWNHKSQRALTSSLHQGGDAWWSTRGKVFPRALPDEWAATMLACDGLIAFDAVLCQGPRHVNSPVYGKFPMRADSKPAVATFSLRGCEGCGKAPEGVTHRRCSSPSKLPLLAPVPIMSSSLHAASTPKDPDAEFVPRCADCITERYCACCNKWWCESCYELPGQRADMEPNVFIVTEGGSPVPVENEDNVDDFFSAANAHAPKFKVRKGLCQTCTIESQKLLKRSPPSARREARWDYQSGHAGYFEPHD